MVRITVPPGLARYLVEKGSVAVDGVSLTVSALGGGAGEPPWFEVSLIPATLAATTLGRAAAGRRRQPGSRRDRQVRGTDAGTASRRRCGHDRGAGPGTVPLDSVERAIADIAAGRAVVVVDDANRENEGDIVFAASKATPELMAFTIRYARGLICAPHAGRGPGPAAGAADDQ